MTQRVSDERLAELLGGDRENMEWNAHGLALDLRDCRAALQNAEDDKAILNQCVTGMRERLNAALAQVAALRAALTLVDEWWKGMDGDSGRLHPKAGWTFPSGHVQDALANKPVDWGVGGTPNMPAAQGCAEPGPPQTGRNA